MDATPALGAVVDNDRGSLPFALIHGEPLIACATWAIAGAFTATTTRSCAPSSADEALARTGTLFVSPPSASRSPSWRIASSVAPRATTLTSQPTWASFTPIQPPMAPAP